MDRFSTPFPITTTNPSTTTIAITNSSSSTSSNVSHSQQNMVHPQNVHFPNNSEPPGFPITPFPPQFCFPPPYFIPFDQNMRFPYVHTFQQLNHHPIGGYPMYYFPIGQSSVRMPNYQPQGWSQSKEEDRKIKEAWMRKIARNKRKQARQRSRSSALAGAPSVPKETIRGNLIASRESNMDVTITQNINTYVFCAPNGKMLKEILTKKLKNSDVGSLGRIILPKKEAEVNLPALWDKEGIDVLVNDVYSDLQWSLKYKYWINNKSRMYVLENTGDFVSHYELQTGDSITLYEDKFKNLHVSTKKEQNLQVIEPSFSSNEDLQTHDTYNYSFMHTTYTHQAKDEEEEASLALLIKELSHKREEEVTNSLLTMCNGGGSSNGIEYDKIEHKSMLNNNMERASSQVAEQTTIEATTSSSKDQTIVIDDHHQNNLGDVYEGLDNIFEVGCDYLLFDHFTN